MKKSMRTLLSFVLILSLLWSVVSVGIATNLSELSWTIYNNGVTKIGTGSTLTGTAGAAVTTVTDKLYTGTDGDGDGKAYYLNKDVFAQYAAAKVSLKKNTYYELTAYYYCDARDAVGGVFSHIMLIKDGGTIATAKDNLGYIDRDKCYYNNENGIQVYLSNRVNSSVVAGQWNKLTIPVYSGNLDEALLTFRPTVQNYAVWIDNIQLTEVQSLEGSDKFLGDFSIYDNTTTILGSGGKATTTTTATVNTASTTKLFTGTGADGDGKAIEFNLGCYAQWPTAKLGVKANTYYELSFYYYCKTLDAFQWGDDGIFSDVVIAKNGGGKTTEADHLYYIGRDKSYYIDSTGAKVTSSARINSGISADKWNKLTMRFYTGNNTDVVLAMRPSGNANPVYVDNIRLTDIVEQKVATDWEMYDMGGVKIGTGGTVRAVDQYYISQDKNIVYTGTDGDGDCRSIAVLGGYAQFTTAKIAVEKNKNYKLTAYYKSSAYNASGVGILSHALIMKDGGANLLKSSEADVLSLINETVGSAYCKKDGVNKSPIANVSTKTNISTTDWNKVELYFNSGELTSVLAAFRITNQNVPVYFDGISLTEVSVIPTDDQLLHNFKIYDNSTQKIGTGGLPTYQTTAKAEADTSVVYTGTDGDGDGKSIKLSSNTFAQNAAAKMSVSKNKNYKLSLYYKANSVNSSSGVIFSHAFVIKDGGTNPVTNPTAKTDVLSYIDANSGNAYCKNDKGVNATIGGISTKDNVSTTDWNKLTLYFNSGNLEEVLVSFRPTNNNPQGPVYLDGFKLEEVAVLPCDDQLLHGWKVYNMTSDKIGVGGTIQSGAKAELETEVLYTGTDGDGNGKAIKLSSAYAQYAAAKMAVAKNKNYKFSFYYKTNSINATTKVIFSHAFIVKDGSANPVKTGTKTDVLSYIDDTPGAAYLKNASGKHVAISGPSTNDGTSTTDWNKMTLYFNSGNLEEVLVTFRATNNTPVYFDGFKLEEVTVIPYDDQLLHTWKIYDNTTSKIGTGAQKTYTAGAKAETVTDVYYDAADGDGDTKAIKVTNSYAQYSTAKLEVAKNKNYKLSLYYKSDSVNSSSGVIFSHAFIIKDGGTNPVKTPTAKTDVLSYIDADAGNAYCKNEKGKTASISGISTKDGASTTEWNKLTLYFNSGDLENVLVAFRATNNTPVYFDGFKLEEVESIPCDDQLLQGFKIYDNSTEVIGTGGRPTYTADAKAEVDTSVVYSGADGDGDIKSIKVSNFYAQFATAKLNVEKNKNYKLTLYYLSPEVNATQNSIFSHAFVIKDGGKKPITSDQDTLAYVDTVLGNAYTKTADGKKLIINDASTANGVAKDTWNKLELYFNSGNLEQVLVSFRANNTLENCVVYFDGFTLSEISELPGVDAELVNWQIFDNTTEKIGTGGKPTYSAGAKVDLVTDKLYTGTGADNDGYAYRLNGDCYAQYAAKPMSFEANTYYQLTAYYMPSKVKSGSVFSHVKMVKDGGACLDSTTDDLGAVCRTYSYYTNKNNCIVPLEETTSKNVKADKWNKITLSFYSGEQTSGWFTLRTAVDTKTTVYLDAITLTKVDKLTGANKVPSGWNVYTMQTEKLGTGGSRHPNGMVDIVTDKLYKGKDGDGDGKAYMLDKNTYAQYATLPLTVEKNTYYNLVFYYYGTTLGSEDSILGEVKVTTDGANNTVAGAENLGYLSRTSAYYTNQYSLPITKYDAVFLSNTEKKTWNKVQIPFYSGELTKVLLSVRPVAYSEKDSTVGTPVYVDGIKLNKTSKDKFAYADTKPFEGWGGPRDVAEINFDDFYVPMDLSQRMQLVDAPAKDSKVTTAVHILEGSYSSATVPNLGAVGSDTDPIFTIPVLPSTKYSIKYSLYITEGQPALSYFGFYYDFFYTDGTEDTNTIIRNTGMPQRGEWVTFESFFTTKPDQTVCTLAWNAGHKNIDMYIDDIILRKLQPGVAYDATDSSYSEDFYNILIDNDVIDDIKAAKSGVYKLPVKTDAFYTFGLNAGSSKKSNSRIFLSFDGVNPMVSGADAPSSIITANGKMNRYGMSFITDYSGYVYIVIENDDNALMIEEPTLFFAYKLTRDENKGYLADPNKAFETYSGPLKELWVLGDSNEFFTGIAQDNISQDFVEEIITDTEIQTEQEDEIFVEPEADIEDASPQTGSKSVLPILVSLIGALLLGVFCIPQKKEVNENE